MATYQLRMSCEYFWIVEAESEEDARVMGETAEPEEWEGYTWSPVEVEAMDEDEEE